MTIDVRDLQERLKVPIAVYEDRKEVDNRLLRV